jgi:hypothetical protein
VRRHRRHRTRQREIEPREQVVVGHHPGAPLARLQLFAHGQRKPPAHRGNSGAPAGLDRSRRGRDRRARDRHRLRARERRLLVAVEAPHVQVVDDLLEQIPEVLDERDVARVVAEDPEAAEHLLAEAVRRRDRRRRRSRRAPAPDASRASATSPEDSRPTISSSETPCLQPALDGDQAVAHALAQLAGGHPREGHQQQIAKPRALGDVARRERGDRVRLAGTRRSPPGP